MIERLSEVQEAELEAFARDWCRTDKSPQGDFACLRVENAFKRIYADLELPSPLVVFCSSPWQVSVLQGLVLLQIFEPKSELVSLLKAELVEPIWCEALARFDENRQALDMASMLEPRKSGSHFDDGLSPADARRELFGRSVESPMNFRLSLALEGSAGEESFSLSDKLSLRVQLRLRQRLLTDLARELPELYRPRPDRFRSDVYEVGFGDSLKEQLSEPTYLALSGACQKFMTDRKQPGSGGLSSSLQPIASFFRAFLPLGIVPQYPNNLPLLSFVATRLAVEMKDDFKNLFSDWSQIKQHAFHYFAYEKIVFVSRYPTELYLDERLRLNCESGPAIVFEDGFALYFVEGVAVSKEIVDETENITVRSIEQEGNVEVRRIMIQRYGLDRFIKDSGAVEVDRDACGVLYRKDQKNDEAIMVVDVIDATSAEQGDPRHYFLRVPPYMKTARAAVAWTFGLQEGEYDPSKQT